MILCDASAAETAATQPQGVSRALHQPLGLRLERVIARYQVPQSSFKVPGDPRRAQSLRPTFCSFPPIE